MTLEQYAAIAEIVGVILVIASLVYVAKQLGQNTEMMRANASAQRVQRDAELNFKVTDSQEFTEIWLKGTTAFDSLSEAERFRLIFFSRSAIVHWHHMFSLRSKKMFPNSDWNVMTWLIRHIGRRQDTQEACKMFRDSFDESFQKFLDAELAAPESRS